MLRTLHQLSGIELLLPVTESSPMEYLYAKNPKEPERYREVQEKTTKKLFIPIVYGYCDGQFDPIKINHTEYYIGPVVDQVNSTNFFGGQLVLTPKLELAPSVKLGPKYAYAGIELPLEIGVNMGVALYENSAAEENNEALKNDFWIPVVTLGNYSLFDKLSFGTSLSVTPVVGVKIPVINKKAELKWDAATLFEAEFAFTEDGLQYKGEFVGIEF